MEEELEKQTHAMEQERKVLFAKLAKEEQRWVRLYPLNNIIVKLNNISCLLSRVKELEAEINALRGENEALKKQQPLGGSGSSVAAAKARQFSGELARRGTSTTWKLAVVIIYGCPLYNFSIYKL